jgi:glycosyltransferase involved in cell wall biosynthesis
MPEDTRILLLSAYDAVSHQQWRSSLRELLPTAHWTMLSLPARHFAWRARGNSLTWAFNHRRELTDNYELLIATSLTDLSALRGFVPELANIPTLVYFHENQFAYPDNANPADYQAQNLLNIQLTSIYTALCADHIAFNSDWNRRSFLAGARLLLHKLPDHVPCGLIDQLEQHSQVLPVPLPDSLFGTLAWSAPKETWQEQSASDVITIVWNHRHEYDKGPELLLAIVQELAWRRVRFRLHLLGQRFRNQPATFKSLSAVLSDHYDSLGIEPGIDTHIEDRHDYHQLLRHCDVVLSTARHDFQGLSVLEACALGCTPLVPDALAYPEYFPSHCRYPVTSDDPVRQARAAADCLLNLLPDLPAKRPDVSQLSASALAGAWHNALNSLLKP